MTGIELKIDKARIYTAMVTKLEPTKERTDIGMDMDLLELTRLRNLDKMTVDLSPRFKKALEKLYSDSPERIKQRLDEMMFFTVLEQLDNLEYSGRIDKTLEYLIKSGMTEEEIINKLSEK